ncbi:prophage regulatory protein [Mizugakiibacter sediminis]|uniref:DNA-binding protein n=1 Tax=Mizugakiibacter sediminis TaxID=1475481 RepID=A0A0K8QQT2_9GAMM|nr:AlpA family transcriptional regulator [Mizugakiibacter sediminis]GAP67258.1 prophage regulatory protein [Mizugakiibacter sediminis]
MQGTTTPPRLLRLPEVIRTTGLSRSSIYDLIAQGRFPRPIPLTASARAWDSREIEIWIAERIAARDEGAAA